MKKLFIVILLLFFISPSNVFAESEYVLPYPASMPGSKVYQLQEIKNKILGYWYFGNFGQFTYNLTQSDKFLVEAKTLFEYKQYLLAHRALKKSDYYFSKTPNNLENAKKEYKNITQKQTVLKEAALKHIEVLSSLQKTLPEEFIWKPEKSPLTILPLKADIEQAITLRMQSL